MTEPHGTTGFLDIQINGGGSTTADPSSIWEVGRHHPETGVTTPLPTIALRAV